MTFSKELSRLVSRDHLLRSLRKVTGTADVQLCKDAEVERATGRVEGFTSIILRVKVSYCFHGDESSTRSMVLVVKCLPQVESQLELVKQCRLFLREGVYFDKVVPMIVDISRGKVEVPLPDCYASIYGGDSDSQYMEDLTQRDFRTPDIKYRIHGLDLPHFVVSIKILGRLHGLMVAAERAMPPGKGGLMELVPELSREALFYDQIPGEPPSFVKGMIEKGLENLLHFSKEIDGLPKEAKASGMLEKVSRGTWNTMCRLVKPDSKGHNVLCHGDVWMNNMMFRYETDESGVEKPVDAKFIDLQIARYCHPSIDILYFLYFSATKTLRDNHTNRLVTDYYNSMLDTLKTLEAGPPPLTFDELLDDLHGKYKPFGVIIGVVFTPILFLGDFVPPKAEDMSPEIYKKLFETGNASMARLRFSSDPDYRDKVVDNIREFVDIAFPGGLKSIELSPILT